MKGDLVRIAAVAVAAAAVGLRLWEPLPNVSVIGVVATLAGGWPIFSEAFENLRERKMTMELSMTIALVAALTIGQFFTALVITAFVLAAEVLEEMTVARGRHAIRDVLDLLPRTARVQHDGRTTDIDVGELRAGDVVLVDPGSLIPVDGTVVGGNSFVDEARITGESLPVEKLTGAAVFAGSVNQSGAMEVRTEKVGRDTTFGKIVEAVETAERSRAPIQRLADRLAGYLVVVALSAAAVTFLATRDPRATISVIIVAGACGVAAGTPLAVLGAIGRAAREGIIIKGGRYLEALSSIDTVILDKTGTVTFGRPRVSRIVPASDVAPSDLLRAAASAEARSEHPLAGAILARAAEAGVEPTVSSRFAYTPGRGVRAVCGDTEILVGNAAFLRENGIAVDAPDVSADGASLVLVAEDGRYLGAIAIADEIRPEARAAIDALRALGIRTVLLTGDVRRVAEAVGRELGVDEIGADLLPDDKRAFVADSLQRGSVAMIGDGVNDAPALMQATVGIAMGSGTAVARESADIVLLGNDLSRFVETIRIARRTRAIVAQNFIGTIAVDAIGMLLAAVGLLGPLPAAVVHVTSELAFILNATRMLPGRSSSPASTVQASRTEWEASRDREPRPA